MRRRWKQMTGVLMTAFFLAGCGQKDKVLPSESMTVESISGTQESIKSNANVKEVRLEKDYYEYVNGKTLASKEIPSDSNSWSYFYELQNKNNERISGILKELSETRAQIKAGTIEQKIADLYLCALDEEGRKKAGLGKLTGYLDMIQNASTIQEYLEGVAEIEQEIGVSSLISFSGDVDLEDSSKYAWYVAGADLGPGKETLEDQSQEEVVKKYQAYVASILELSGLKKEETKKAAQSIVEFQKDLAKSALPLEEQGNPDRIYNPYTKKELQKLFSNVQMDRVLKKAGIEKSNSYIVTEVELNRTINNYLKEENLSLLKNYSTFCLINDFAGYLTPEIERRYLQWYQEENGIKESKTKEKRAGILVEGIFGFELGEIYSKKYFSEEDKKAVKKMVTEIQDSYKNKISKLDWMEESTKEAAKRKLETMEVKIGYPDVWPNYFEKSQVVSAEQGGSLIDNIITLMKDLQTEKLKRYNSGKVDRHQWFMTPQTINAYYNPSANEIVFPAGIMQAPFYDSSASNEKNMGGIGTVIAHEISHAFDNNGALYDEKGNYSEWWTEKDKKKFEERTKAVVMYYNGYEGFKGRMVNGKQTLGENIADLGAVSCIVSIVGKDKEKLQKVFTQYATVWASKYTDESMIKRLNTDVHSPSHVRVNAVLSSIDEFYIAYPEIKEGDGMYVAPDKRVKVW